MTTVIFVHGTGGRGKEYLATFQQIEKVFGERRPDVKVESCLWGEKDGVKLNTRFSELYWESRGNISESRDRCCREQ